LMVDGAPIMANAINTASANGDASFVDSGSWAAIGVWISGYHDREATTSIGPCTHSYCGRRYYSLITKSIFNSGPRARS